MKYSVENFTKETQRWDGLRNDERKKKDKRKKKIYDDKFNLKVGI